MILEDETDKCVTKTVIKDSQWYHKIMQFQRGTKLLLFIFIYFHYFAFL